LKQPMPPSVRTALLEALQTWGHPNALPQLLEGWSALTPSERAERLEFLTGRPEWIPGLLSALENNGMSVADLSPSHKDTLRNQRDEAIRSRARKILPPPQASTEPISEKRRLAEADRLHGSPTRGRGLFEERCISCHAVRGEGNTVGPDLAVYASKPFDEFLTALVDPNAAVDPRHVAHTVTLNDGREWTGVVTEASDQTLTLLLPGGHREHIPKTSIQQHNTLVRSLMPEGLTEGWSPQALADLVSWIRNP
jgi:putative heme-binding domain-containing protein